MSGSDDGKLVLSPTDFRGRARLAAGLVYAEKAHREQRRKGGDIPYIAHLLAVASVVLEGGGDAELAIAALLHDAVEDQGGQQRLDEIRRLFGDRVAEIVHRCSDTDTVPKPPWQPRKEAYLRRLRDEVDAGVLLVALADKLCNLRSLISDLRTGSLDWSAFRGGREGTLWYYETVGEIAAGKAPLVPRVAADYAAGLAELRTVAG